jgi:hypothetical protein
MPLTETSTGTMELAAVLRMVRPDVKAHVAAIGRSSGVHSTAYGAARNRLHALDRAIAAASIPATPDDSEVSA